MPAASLLLSLLARLRRLIPSVLGLLPDLLRPPATASRFSPLALPLPPFVPRLPPCALGRPPFAVGRSPFVVSPSASSGQALSNHERPLHRPGYPNLLALPPSYRRPPVFRLWTPTRPNRGPADPAPRQSDTPKNPPNLAPAGPAPPTGEPGQRARVPQKPAPQPPPPTPGMPVETGIQSYPGLHRPAAQKASFRRARGERAFRRLAEGESSLHAPRPQTQPRKRPAPQLEEFFGKNSYTRETHPKIAPSTPHRPQPPFVRFLGQNLELATT